MSRSRQIRTGSFGTAARPTGWPGTERIPHLAGVVTGLGLVSDAFATIQIDLNVVHRTDPGGASEMTLCDHNCVVEVDGVSTGGNYCCPAAMSLNRGARRTSLAPAESLLTGLRSTIDGIRRAQRRFLAHDVDSYLRREGVPQPLHAQFVEALSAQKIVVNLFGGSPETHPQVLDIITDLQHDGAEVHLTTTGRRILRDPAFREDFVKRPPDLIGLGADDFESPADIDRLFGLDYEQLTRLWRATPWQHGQRRKSIEAVQICKLTERLPMPILFNIVLHSANLAWAEAVLDSLTRNAGPAVILNPYPVQSAFLSDPGQLDAARIADLGTFVGECVDVHMRRVAGLQPRWNLARRFGYWVLMQALIEQEAERSDVSDQVGGDGVWRCYTARGAGRCVQVGMGDPRRAPSPTPGGYLGCFWNTTTVTHEQQFWTLRPDEIADWILDGRQRAAARAASPCRGCLFPRMSMDAVSLELGLTPRVLDLYRRGRATYLGY
jgi:hypothetical protein